MSQIIATPVISGYDSGGGYSQAWTSDTAVTLNPSEYSQIRQQYEASALAALHDGCVISDIRIETTASKSIGLASARCAIYFGSVSLIQSLTDSPTVYWTSGGAGVAPSDVRAWVAGAWAHNQDTFYDVTVTMSLITITITFEDRGLGGMIQFSL